MRKAPVGAICVVYFTFALAVSGQNKVKYTEQQQPILDKIKTLRSIPDDKRGEVTQQLARDIRNLPPDDGKLALANGLAGLSTEGDFGRQTLQEVAITLADAIRQNASAQTGSFSQLAELIRYEHVTVDFSDPRLDKAMAELEAFDRDRQNADFTLKDMSGNSFSLKDLRGKVVLVNFWATWCPPCRKELPDLSALQQRFDKQGLVILAISDEEAPTVSKYLAEHPVSYTVLLDPGRHTEDAFHVDGIPKSFVYDREGKLVAQAIDMRTQGQFLAMLEAAGLNVN